MRPIYITALLVLAAQAPPSGKLKPEELMDRIERQVVLPPRARSFAAYGRNYRFLGPDKVIGLYQIPEKPFDRKQSCSWGGKPCTPSQVEKLVKDREELLSRQARAGQRRWFAGAETMLEIADGGCRQVTILYDVAADQILSVGCNGRG